MNSWHNCVAEPIPKPSIQIIFYSIFLYDDALQWFVDNMLSYIMLHYMSNTFYQNFEFKEYYVSFLAFLFRNFILQLYLLP